MDCRVGCLRARCDVWNIAFSLSRWDDVMKVPIVDNALGLASGVFGFMNKKMERRRQAVIRSSKMVVELLRDVEIPKRARHYVDQMEERMNRIN